MPSFTTRANVKTYLGKAYSPAQDDLIDLLIPRLSADFETETDRTFSSTAYFGWQDGSGDNFIHLRQYPIISLRRVTTGTDGAGTLTNTTTNATHATATVSGTSLSLSRVVSGVANTDTLVLADSATLTLLSTAITALSKDWTFSVESTFSLFPSVQLRPGFVGNCLSPTTGSLEIADSDSLTVDIASFNAGVLHSNFDIPRGSQNVFVDYTAGYATMPDDLTHLITKIVAWGTLQSGADFTMKRESLDNYEYERDLSNLSTSALEQFKDDVNKWKRYSF